MRKIIVAFIFLFLVSGGTVYAADVEFGWCQPDYADGTLNGVKLHYSDQSGVYSSSVNVAIGNFITKPANITVSCGVTSNGDPVVGTLYYAAVTGLNPADTFFKLSAYYDNNMESDSTDQANLLGTGTNGNTLPVIKATDASVTEGGLLTHSITAIDPDGDTVSISLSDPYNASFNPTTGLLSWTPGNDTCVAAQCVKNVIITANDGNEDATKTITITVTNFNNPPVITALDSSVSEGSLLNLSITATDADLDTVTISASNLPNGANFAAIPGSATLTWTPSNDFCAQNQCVENVTITATDGTVTVNKTIAITVDNVNRPPVINEANSLPTGNVEVMEGVGQEFSVSASDPDGDTLTYKWTANGDSSQSVNAPKFTYVPSFDTAGINSTATVTVSVQVSGSVSYSWSNVIVEDRVKGDLSADRYVDYEDLFTFLSNMDQSLENCDGLGSHPADFDTTCSYNIDNLAGLEKVWHAGVKVVAPNGGEGMVVTGQTKVVFSAKDPTDVDAIDENLDIVVEAIDSNGNAVTISNMNWDTTQVVDGAYSIRVNAISPVDAANSGFNKTDSSDNTFLVKNDADPQVLANFVALVKAVTVNAEGSYGENISIQKVDESDTSVTIDVAISGLEDLHKINFDIAYDSDALQNPFIKEGELLTSLTDKVSLTDDYNNSGMVSVTVALLNNDDKIGNAGSVVQITFDKAVSDEVLESDFTFSSLVFRNSSNEDLKGAAAIDGGGNGGGDSGGGGGDGDNGGNDIPPSAAGPSSGIGSGSSSGGCFIQLLSGGL